jgi:RNA polymerase sigma-70 factor (ECF subfamily)
LNKTTFIDLANAPAQTDEELFNSFIATQDREVMGLLFRKYMSLVFGVCMKYLREKNTAQDNTMEIFERLIQHQPSSEIKNFKAFLFVVSKNHCLMKQRGEKMMSMEISESDMESAMQMHLIDSSRDEKQDQLLQKCMKTLKDFQKDCITMFYLKKKSYLEISRDLKMNLNAVKSHIQNGKRNLKICIEAGK